MEQPRREELTEKLQATILVHGEDYFSHCS